jgi:hypothetical protein
MLKYNFVQYGVAGKDKRVRPMAPSQASIEALFGWFVAHLATLDALDGGQRLATFMTDTASLARIEPLIADGLLSSHPVREPGQTFSLFTWLNNGGVVMDWLISSIEEVDAETDRIPTGVLSVADMANWLKLSRTHLARKLRAAEQLGSLGWQGKRGHSVMWVSKGFWQEFALAQAGKLAEVERGEPGPSSVTHERRAAADAPVGEPASVGCRQPLHLPSTTRSLPARSGVIVTRS